MSAEEIKTLEALKVEEEKYVASLDGILAKGVVSWGRYFASLKNLFTGNLQGGTGALATTAATALFPPVGLLAPFVVSQTPLMPGVQPSATPSPNARGPGRRPRWVIADLSAGVGVLVAAGPRSKKLHCNAHLT